MTSSRPPRPSSVRKRILREHAALRERLDQLASAVVTLEAGREQSTEAALELAGALYLALRDHIDHEDSVLVPILRDADAWGKVRAEQLAGHHALQRAAFSDASLKQQRGATPAAVAAWLRKLRDELLSDMEHEERELLTVELLRDDPLGIDVEDG
jgi:iron-sulfur cluster repair protein YtfE (RIC family)